MKSSFEIRLTYTGILLISVIFFPFFVSLILAIAGMFFINYFWEAVFLFFLFDLIYGIGGSSFLGIYFGSFFLSIFLILVIEFIKKRLKFYSK